MLPSYTFSPRIKVYPEPSENLFMRQRTDQKQIIYDNEMLNNDPSGTSPQATG